MDEASEAVSSQLETVAIMSVVAFFVSLLAYVLGFFNIAPDEKKDRQFSFKYLGGVFLIFLGVQLLAAWFLSRFWRHYIDGEKGWLQVLAIITIALGVFGYFALLPANIRRKIWYNGKVPPESQGLNQFLFGALSWIVAYPIVVVISQLIAISLYTYFGAPEVDQDPVKALSATLSNPLLFTVLGIFTAFVVPAIEELIFRGFMQSWFKSFMGRMPAVIFTAFIFAVFHFSSNQGLSNIEYILSLFVFSVFLGFVYERQNSLWAPIGLHSAFNSFSIMLIALSE